MSYLGVDFVFGYGVRWRCCSGLCGSGLMRYRFFAALLLTMGLDASCSARSVPPARGEAGTLCGRAQEKLVEVLYSESSSKVVASWCGPATTGEDVRASSPYEDCELEVPVPSADKYYWARGSGETKDEHAFEFFDRTADFDAVATGEWRERCGGVCCYGVVISLERIRY